MTESFVIGIAGTQGSGKDTLCDYLVERHGFQKMAFATPLKEIVEKVFPKIPKDHLYGASPKRGIPTPEYRLSGTCPMCSRSMNIVNYDTWVCRCGFTHNFQLTPRLALQTLGTEWGRRLYPEVWVDYVFEEIAKLPPGRFCISDVRLPNEVQGILDRGGEVIRLRRNSPVTLKRSMGMWETFKKAYGSLKADKYQGHISETSLDSIPDSMFAEHIQNDSTIPVLYERADEAIRRIL